MFDKNYMLKFTEYAGKKIRYSINENDLKIYADAEIQYILRKLDRYYTLLMIERGVETKIEEFHTKIEMQRKFPIWIKGLIGARVEYPYIEKFEQLTNINFLHECMKQYTNCELFSINQIAEDKIVLKNNADDSYDLLFVDRNLIKYFIEQNEKAPFVFERFYMEVVYYSEMLKRFKEYELCFEDELDYECKLKMLNY